MRDADKSIPGLVEVVHMKVFCEFSFADIVALQKRLERTVQRKWETARIYLHRSMCVDLPV